MIIPINWKDTWSSCISPDGCIFSKNISKREYGADLLSCPWFYDYSRHIMGCKPADFVEPLLDEMLRSSAAIWQGGRLVSCAPYNPPLADWPTRPVKARDWPKLT